MVSPTSGAVQRLSQQQQYVGLLHWLHCFLLSLVSAQRAA